MKRMFSFFLALALLAVLSGCGKQEPTPSKPDEPTPPPEEGITLTELNVEFVAGDRDTDALMQLKKELPPLLIGALADEGVTVGRVNVTFGASDEATADALARGSVQVGFMPMETYLAHKDTLRLVSVPEEPAGDTERVGLYFPASDQNRTLRAAFEKDAADGGALHAWETLLGSFWMDNGSDPVFAVPVDDDVARRFLDSMMDVNANGMMADSIPRLTEYVSADEVFSTADLVVLHGEAPDEALWMEIYGCTVGGETVSVSTADAIVGGDEFAAALLAALESSVRTRRHRRCCGSTMETVCATVGPTRRLWNLRSICSAIQRAFTSSRASKRETRGDAARFLASAQAQIIICIPLSSMPISIFGTPGAYSPSSVHGMLPSLSAVTWRTWRKMSALLVSYSS